MQGTNTWSYRPYRPYFFEVGDIYICRVVPYETAVHVEFLNDENILCRIYCKKRTETAFALMGETAGSAFDLSDLETDTDYEFYVESAGLRSRVRLARTGASVGTTVNYLHPDDGAYAFSGNALCSPSLLRHPDGYLLASMDVYKGKAPQNLTLIFRSDDDGETWHYVNELYPCFWGKLFMHKGILYMLACSTEYGDLLIGASRDGGNTFAAPTVLLRGSCKCTSDGVHKNPQNIVRHKGRIYETLEWGCWANGYHAVMVMSADENDDLLDPASWHFTEPVRYDPDWEGTAKGPSRGNIEGTLAVTPDGKLLNIMRYDMTQTESGYGLVLAYLVDTEQYDAPLTYSHAIKLDGNHSKFMIKRDGKTGKYYTIISRITSKEGMRNRNLLSLMESDDLENWTLTYDIIDKTHLDPRNVGFQYVDFEIEGDDIIALVRTAYNHAHNYHDANYSTFLKLKHFTERRAPL